MLWIVLTNFWLNAALSGLLVLVGTADLFFNFLEIEAPKWRRILQLVVWATWACVNWWILQQILFGRRRGLVLGLPLLLLLVVQGLIARPLSLFAIGVALLSIAALVAARDELTRS